MPQGQYSLSQIETSETPATKQMGQYRLPETPSEVTQSVTPRGAVDIAKTITANLPSKETLASGAAGAGATALTGSPLVGSATMAALDQLLNPKSQEQTPGQNIRDMFLNTGLNEVGGRLASGAIKIGREIIKPGSVLPDEMRSLLPFKPTASQLTGSNILNIIENAFAGSSKEAALAESGKIVDNEANNLVKNFTGRSDISLQQPFKQSEFLQKDIENQFDASKLESNKRGLATNLISKANKVQVPVYGQIQTPASSLLGPNGLPISNATTSYGQTGTRTVNGPVLPTKLFKEAQDLLDNINRSDVKPDPNSPLIKALNDIISNNKDFDARGNVVARVRDFGDMWETKKAIDDIAYASPKSQIVFTDTRFKKLSQALNQDIENALPQWPTNGKVALNLWNESKQIVADRQQLFSKAPIEKLVNNEDKIIPAINAIIDNPRELGKALVAGELKIPDQGGFKYITSNTRKDLQGYELMRLFNDSGGDGNKLVEMFQNPNKQESYKLLFSAQNRADIEQFFKNAAMVSQKGQTGMRPYWLLRLTGTGLGLGAGIISGIATNNIGLGTGAGIVSGTVGLNAVGKLLTNPTYARLLVGMAQGGPLNMTTMAAGRLIAHGLKNTPMTLEYSDGNKIQGKIDAQGKFVLPVGDQNK